MTKRLSDSERGSESKLMADTMMGKMNAILNAELRYIMTIYMKFGNDKNQKMK